MNQWCSGNRHILPKYGPNMTEYFPNDCILYDKFWLFFKIIQWKIGPFQTIRSKNIVILYKYCPNMVLIIQYCMVLFCWLYMTIQWKFEPFPESNSKFTTIYSHNIALIVHKICSSMLLFIQCFMVLFYWLYMTIQWKFEPFPASNSKDTVDIAKQDQKVSEADPQRNKK